MSSTMVCEGSGCQSRRKPRALRKPFWCARLDLEATNPTQRGKDSQKTAAAEENAVKRRSCWSATARAKRPRGKSGLNRDRWYLRRRRDCRSR